jgi:hypothetical protein
VAELNELRSETRRLEGVPGRRPRTFGIIIVLILITCRARLAAARRGFSRCPALLSAASYALSRNVVILGMTIDPADQQNWKYQYPSGILGVIGVSAVMLPGVRWSTCTGR